MALAEDLRDLPTPSKAHARAKDALIESHRAAARYSDLAQQRMAKVLERAAIDLRDRIDAQVRLGRTDTFTVVQMQTTLVQISHVIASIVTPGMKDAITTTGTDAARQAAAATIDYLALADKAFTGIAQPLALNEARMFDRATQGAQSSVFARLLNDPEHSAKRGILARYGLQTVGFFEDELAKGTLAKKPWASIRDDLVARSPFLQAAPAHWAERIVRTETMGMHGRGALESAKEAQAQLGDVVKILSCAFDDRTGSDSVADHGMIRRVGEAFASWYGAYDNPPDRPSDRGVLVTHRLSWGVPPAHLQQRPWSEVVARWKREGRRGAPPPRNLMTTVPLIAFSQAKSGRK